MPSKNQTKADKTPDVDIVLSTPEAREIKKVKIFTIDGVDYFIETKPRLGTSLKYLKMARREGEEIAMGFLLEETLGTETYDALAEYLDSGTETQEEGNEIMQSVMAKVRKITLGGLEAPKGS